MQEVQRFNKVLKSCVLLGDIILLNLLLWGFNLFLGTRFWCTHCGSIFQGMTLITLCYLLCNMHSGVILHRPVVRPEQIMIRVLRNQKNERSYDVKINQKEKTISSNDGSGEKITYKVDGDYLTFDLSKLSNSNQGDLMILKNAKLKRTK